MATQKFLDQNGLQTFWEKIKTKIADSVKAIQDNAVLKTGDHTMAGKLTANGGFVGNLTGNVTGKATSAGTADKTKAALTITVKKEDGTSATTTFDGSVAQSATIDMSTLATDAQLNAAIESLGAEIDARVASVTADGTLITATTTAASGSTDKTVKIGPSTKLTTAVGLAENAVRSVTEGSTNGYIAVNTGGTTTGVKVKGINTAAYKEVGYFVSKDTYNTGINKAYAGVTANAGEIANIKNAIAGGTHFIGISTTAITNGGAEKPTINKVQLTTVNNGDIVIYGNKEFIWNGSAWAELGDTTAESNRITALEKWKTTASATISSNSAGVTANAGEIATIKNTITNLSKAVVTSFGGKTGAITVNKTASSITNGTYETDGKVTVKFTVSDDRQLTGEVALPKQIWANKLNIESLTTSHNSLSGTVNTLSGTVNTINKNYATKAKAVGSITTKAASPSGATAISATGNITTWTITPNSVAGAALATAKIEIESIPDSWINGLT